MACAESGIDYAAHPFWDWTSKAVGAGLNLIRYSPALDDLTFSIAIVPDAARLVHDGAEQRLFLLLFEHFDRAMRMAARPVDFESRDEALVMLDSRGRVRAVSDAAERLLDANDGLAIVNGRLIAARREDTAQLDRLLRSALSFLTHGTVGGVALVQRPSGHRAWVVTARPLPKPPKPFEAFRPAVVLHVIDPDAAPSAHEQRLWATTFGLTPTEIRLVEALLADDHGLRSAAGGLGMAYATARVHLAHVFDKTGVRSQLQLAKLLGRIHG
jgi:DNA-binding CsgD family transcriptional regulator